MLLLSSILETEIQSPEDVECYKDNIQSIIKGTKEKIRNLVEMEDYELDELDLLTIQLYSTYINTLEERYEKAYSLYPDVKIKDGGMMSSITYIKQYEA